MERARSFLEECLPKIQTTFAVAIVSYALALTNSPRANDAWTALLAMVSVGHFLTSLCVNHNHGGSGRGIV